VQGARDEIGLAAEARVDPLVHETGVGLGKQIDLHGGVDREHAGMRRYARRIVDGLGRQHAQPLVAVRPAVELV
jgi:hypothetical protein